MNDGRRNVSSDGIGIEALQRVARALARPTKKRAVGTEKTAVGSEPTALSDDGASGAGGSRMDLVAPVREVPLELVSGRGHYDRVIDAIRNAHTSVWIATANVKELMIEDGRAKPGRRRSMKRTSYVSVLAILDELAARGVELRLLHAELPSRPFREEIANHPRLLGADAASGGLALRRCPRVHMKVVVIDGELLYLGSANWTGAGLGAKGSGRRNFELGIVTAMRRCWTRCRACTTTCGAVRSAKAASSGRSVRDRSSSSVAARHARMQVGARVRARAVAASVQRRDAANRAGAARVAARRYRVNFAARAVILAGWRYASLGGQLL